MQVYFLIAASSFFFLATLIVTPLHAEQDLIDQYVEKTLQKWSLPGLSLAIVHKGAELKIQGYGHRERGKSKPVDAKTTFQVASLTKAFVGLTAAMLVEERILDWMVPVRVYVPSLRFKDPIANAEMNLTDLLSHRTGLPGTCDGEDHLWYKKECKTEDLLVKLASVDPLFPFRSHFSYSNLAYVAVSQIIANITGTSWDLFCKERILDPLGMTRTYFSHELLMEDANRAAPHLPFDCQFHPIAHLNWNSMKAAGGMNSCAQDLALWMNYCLSKLGMGSPGFQPQTLVDGQEFVGDPNFAPTWGLYAHDQEIVHYGFGWMMYTLGGRTVFFHLGLTDGMSSVLALVPAETLGIAILINQSYHLADISLLNELLDHFLQLEPIDWHQKSLQIHDSR